MKYSISLSFATLNMETQEIGQDYLITVYGGSLPHIGSVVMAIPRKSLTSDGSISSTSSVLNVVGHKDEFICRKIAEYVCQKKEATVVCTGGFHIDHITTEQITEVTTAVENLISNFV